MTLSIVMGTFFLTQHKSTNILTLHERITLVKTVKKMKIKIGNARVAIRISKKKEPAVTYWKGHYLIIKKSGNTKSLSINIIKVPLEIFSFF